MRLLKERALSPGGGNGTAGIYGSTRGPVVESAGDERYALCLGRTAVAVIFYTCLDRIFRSLQGYYWVGILAYYLAFLINFLAY